MFNVQIVIPSRSRANAQKTIYNLSERLWPIITIVVPQEQYDDYRAIIPMPITILPTTVDGIGPTRQLMLHLNSTGKIIMADDDLTFYKRSLDGTKFSIISGEETEFLIADMVNFLDGYCMVGLVDKFMSQHSPRMFKECTRFNDIHGYNRDILPRPWPQFRTLCEEEHDFHLQLLTRGCKTAVITEYSKTNKVQASGGCSDYRNPESMQKVYQQMMELWPGLVSFTEKPTQFGTDIRIRFNWRAAKEQGGII